MTDPRLADPETFRAIADDTYDWETWFDPEGVPRWVNRAVQRMTGLSAAQCLQLKDYPLPLIHADDRERIARALEGARAGSSGNDVEFRILRGDGAEHWVAMSWQSTFNRRGERLGFRTSIRDIHDRKLLELQLREALGDAQAAQRARDEFVAMMSHELRTPLQVIQGYVELLQGLGPRDEQRRPLELMRVQTELLAELLENVLELSALDAGAPRLRLQAVAVDDLLSQVRDSFEPEARRRGLALELTNPSGDQPPVRTDARVLRQIIANLVQNALKFTERGRVQLRAHTEPAVAGAATAQLVVEVEDTGLGIDAGRMRTIFEPFVQVHDRAATGARGGSGLGLAIARRLAQALGGSLTADSEPGRGSVFRLRLPVTRAGRFDTPWSAHRPAATAEAVTPEFAARYPLAVLVVDDSAPARELLGEILARHGYHARLAQSGREAVKLAGREAYDLILMDLSMPELDGASAMAQIRAQSSQAAVRPRLVALTAGVLPSQEGALVQRGFDAVLLKPVHLETLQGVLRWAAQAGVAPPAGVAAAAGSGGLRADVLADLEAMGADGQNLLRRVSLRVKERLPAHRAALARALDGADPGALARTCHAVKGDCLVIGASACADAAAAAERCASAAGSSRPARQRAVEHLLGALDVLDAELDRLLSE